MKARLTVTVERPDFLEIRRAASLHRLSVSQWIRQALRAELERERAVARKLEAVRRAAKFSCPSGDIEQMLAEIDSGYRGQIGGLNSRSSFRTIAKRPNEGTQAKS